MGSKKESDDVKSPTIDGKSQELDELDLDKNPIKYATSTPGEFTTEAHDKHYMELTLRSGNHSPTMQRILRQRIEARAKEFPRWPADNFGGVRYMWIESRFWYDRERLSSDFDSDWRMYRAKYLNSLELDPREPVHIPEYERQFLNPLRRFFQKPGDWLEEKIIRKFVKEPCVSSYWRVRLTRPIMIYFGIVAVCYYFRYGHQTWENIRGPTLYVTKPILYPGHQNYPYGDKKSEPGHFWDHKFSRRNVFKDLRDYEDNTVTL